MCPSTRRKVLQLVTGSLGSVLAGCAGFRGATQETPTPPDSRAASPTSECTPPAEPTSRKTTTPDDGFPHLSVASNTPPAGYEVATTARLVRPFTADAPAQIRVAFTNTARAERVFWFGSTVPFTPETVRHGTKPAQLQLVPENKPGGMDTNDDGDIQVLPGEPTDGCWQAEDEVIFSDERRFIRLGACETATVVFSVVAHPANTGCIPRGTYRTTSTWETAAEYGETSTDRDATWKLTLTIRPQ